MYLMLCSVRKKEFWRGILRQLFFLNTLFCFLLLYYSFTVLLVYCITCLLYYLFTVLLVYCVTCLLYYLFTILLVYCITCLLYYLLTVLLVYCITCLLYYLFTVLLVYSFSFFNSTCSPHSLRALVNTLVFPLVHSSFHLYDPSWYFVSLCFKLIFDISWIYIVIIL